jgi:hypothetical protein
MSGSEARGHVMGSSGEHTDRWRKIFIIFNRTLSTVFILGPTFFSVICSVASAMMHVCLKLPSRTYNSAEHNGLQSMPLEQQHVSTYNYTRVDRLKILKALLQRFFSIIIIYSYVLKILLNNTHFYIYVLNIYT